MGSSQWRGWLWALVPLGAALASCGGSSRSDGTGAAAGSGASSGTSGGGGVAAGGVGGAGGASGGTGGSSGGAAGAGGSIPISEIEALCAQIDQLPCKLDDCVSVVTHAAADALEDDCAAEFAAVIACALKNPMICVAGEDGPQLAFECQPALEALEECGGASTTCGIGSNGTECQIDCSGSSGYSASCTPSGAQGMSCTCTSGGNSGAGFTVVGSCNDNTWIDAAEAHCGG